MGISKLKWAYEMGRKHERERMERCLYQELGTVPQEPADPLPTRDSLHRFYIARNRWYGIQAFLNDFFGHANPFDYDQIDRLLEDNE